MTSDTIHDISPAFTWQNTHADHLRHIADTDEYCYDDSVASSSTSTAAASRRYDWPTLKDAIKYRINECLEQELAESQDLLLHPAAALIPFMHEDGDNTHIVPSSSSHTAVGDDDEPASPSRARGPENHANGTPPNPSQRPYVPPADTQNFFPSKRQPVSTTTTPLTPAQVAAQRQILFSMLDDFDLQPPFTIQRVAELVLRPRQYYRSAHKWIAALKRCLAVTATRDAFPISPVQAPVGGRAVNGHAENNGQQAPDMTELEMDRLDGLPPAATADETMAAAATTRPRSSHNASINDPLFSPIPFLVKHETAASANGDHMDVTDNIPDLELGGADRTQAQMPGTDSTPRELVDFSSPPRSNSSGSMAAPPSAAVKSAADQDMAASEGPTATVAERVDEEMPSQSSDAQAGKSAHAPRPVPTSTGTADLGIPDGQVDEMDNPAHQMHPLSFTTTPAPVAAEDPTPPDAADDDSPRHTKRRKSVASIHD